MVRISALAWPRLSRSISSGRATSPKMIGMPFAAAGGDGVDVRIDRDIGPAVGGQHLGDQPADPAEADDHRPAASSPSADRWRASSCRRCMSTRRAGVPAELGEQGREGEADGGDDLPEGGGLGADQLAAAAAASTIRVVSDGEAMIRPASAATAARAPLRRSSRPVTSALSSNTPTTAPTSSLPIGGDEPQVDAHPDRDQEDAERRGRGTAR